MAVTGVATLGHEVLGRLTGDCGFAPLLQDPTSLCFLERKNSLFMTLSLVISTTWIYS